MKAKQVQNKKINITRDKTFSDSNSPAGSARSQCQLLTCIYYRVASELRKCYYSTALLQCCVAI